MRDNDLIASLLENPFWQRSKEEQYSIIENGRPVPMFSILKAHPTEFRTTQQWYDRYKWLCGSSTELKFFCWPCILSGQTGIWAFEGYDVTKNLSREISCHGLSQDHLTAQLSLNSLSKHIFARNELRNKERKLKLKIFNNEVKQNRAVLSVLFDVASVVCKRELAFRWRDSGDAKNPDDFTAILNLTLSKNQELKQHWESTADFRELSETIQHELMEIFQDKIHTFFDSNIAQTSFYSCIVNGSRDINDQTQCSLVLRFVDTGGEIQEHFAGFFFVKKQRTAESVFEILSSVLEKYDMKNKLVAQAYDGESVMSGELYKLEAKVQEAAPRAAFTHCYAHGINNVLQQCCCNITSVRIFFNALEGMSGFFRHSPARVAVLDRILGQKLPEDSENFWDGKGNLIAAVHSNQSKLIDVFHELSTSADAATVREAHSYMTSLTDFTFVFLLAVFQNLFEKADNLFRILENTSYDTHIFDNSVVSCLTSIRGLRSLEKYDEFIGIAEEVSGSQPAPKRRKISNSNRWNARNDNFEQVYFEILDNVITQLEVRFGNRDSDSVQFLKLGDTLKFDEYHQNFPNDALNSLMDSYGEHFNEEQLRAELKTIFFPGHAQEFQGLKLSALIRKMKDDGVDEILEEAYKMFVLIATIPSSRSTDQRSSACLKRMNTYLRKTQKGHPDLALLAVEKEVLRKLEDRPCWKDDLIENYAKKKNPPLNLLYRSTNETG